MQAIVIDALFALIIVPCGNASGTFRHRHPVAFGFFCAKDDLIIAIFVRFELCVVEGGPDAITACVGR